MAQNKAIPLKNPQIKQSVSQQASVKLCYGRKYPKNYRRNKKRIQGNSWTDTNMYNVDPTKFSNYRHFRSKFHSNTLSYQNHSLRLTKIGECQEWTHWITSKNFWYLTLNSYLRIYPQIPNHLNININHNQGHQHHTTVIPPKYDVTILNLIRDFTVPTLILKFAPIWWNCPKHPLTGTNFKKFEAL